MEVEERGTRFGAAHVLAWSTVLLGFGLIQGTLYLKGYWGAFGLDPFQFGNASDLALIGLTGIGVTVAFMLVAAVAGGYLAQKILQFEQTYRYGGWIVLLVAIALSGVLLFVVSFGWLLCIGVLLTWALIWLVKKAPDIPSAIRDWKLLPYAALALAYIPMGAYFLGQRNAAQIKIRHSGVVVTSTDALQCHANGWKFAGRLNDVYVIYCRVPEAVTVIPANSDSVIRLQAARAAR